MPNFRGASRLFENVLIDKLNQREQIRRDTEAERRRREELGTIQSHETEENRLEREWKAEQNRIDRESQNNITNQNLIKETEKLNRYSRYIIDKANREGISIQIPPNADENTLDGYNAEVEQAIIRKHKEEDWGYQHPKTPEEPEKPYHPSTSTLNEIDKRLASEFFNYLSEDDKQEIRLSGNYSQVYYYLPAEKQNLWDWRKQDMISGSKTGGTAGIYNNLRSNINSTPQNINLTPQTQTPIPILSPQIPTNLPPGVPPGSVKVGQSRNGKSVYKSPDGRLFEEE